MEKILIIMTAEQSKIMSEWVKDGLNLINDKHAEFHRTIIDQYPDRDYIFHQSVVMNCVCSAIIRMGIEYLKMASFGEIGVADIERLLASALTNEFSHEACPDMGTQTKQ
jgi:hypothetical protein